MKKLTNEDLLNVLNTNQCGWKRNALNMFNELSTVNNLMTDSDANLLINDSSFYDALHDYNYPFVDLIDDFYLCHLYCSDNNNDVMIMLQMIYAS